MSETTPAYVDHPYDLTVRWGLTGQLEGVSYATRRVYAPIEGDDDPRPPRVGDPMHVDLDALAPLMDKAGADALLRVQVLEAEAETLREQVDAVVSERDALTTAATQLTEALEQARATVQTAMAQIQQQQALIADLRVQAGHPAEEPAPETAAG